MLIKNNKYVNENIKYNSPAMKKENFFGTNLRKLRKSMGISQTVLAERINESTGAKLRHNVISNYENGVTLPSLGLVPTIASILNISVDLLLGVKQAEDEAVQEESTAQLTKKERMDQLKAEQLDLQPFLHISRVDVSVLSRHELIDVLNEQYDLIDQLLKEITRLKDDNISTKERLFDLREKFETFLGK